MTMKRMNFYLADIQIKRLKAINKKTGLPLSDILRRAIDEYWERSKKKERSEMKKVLVVLIMVLVAFTSSGCATKKYCFISPGQSEVTTASVGSIMIKKNGMR